MDIRNYRESRPVFSSRFAFCKWINEALSQRDLNISVPYLRDLESGRSIPSLRLAVAVEDITNRQVTVRDWVGLSLR